MIEISHQFKCELTYMIAPHSTYSRPKGGFIQGRNDAVIPMK